MLLPVIVVLFGVLLAYGTWSFSSLSQELGSFLGPQSLRGHSLILVQEGSCPCTLYGLGSCFIFFS